LEYDGINMAKPVLITVDDDVEVLRAIERDLRRKYAGEYRVLRADSGQSALEIVRNSSSGTIQLRFFWWIRGCLVFQASSFWNRRLNSILMPSGCS